MARSSGTLSNHFAGRTAIVTGGASGIGRALSAVLVEAGAAVVVADLDGDGAHRVATELGDGRAAGTAVGRALDVADREAVTALVDETADRPGGLDLLFNNAGIALGGPFERIDPADWDRIIDVNLRGVVNGVMAAYPRMVAQGGGHIVNTASAAGLVPPPFVAPYAATKAGVVGLSAALRTEAALRGVRVSVVCPGMVETPILDGPAPAPGSPASLTARQYMAIAGQKPVPADRFARAVLHDVARNRGVIVHPATSRVLWGLGRHAPRLTQRMLDSIARKVDAHLQQPAPAGADA